MGIFESIIFFLVILSVFKVCEKKVLTVIVINSTNIKKIILFYKNDCRLRLKFFINTQIMIMIYLLEDDDDKLIALSYSFIKVWRRFLLNSFLSDWVQAIKDTKTNEVNNNDILKDVLIMDLPLHSLFVFITNKSISLGTIEYKIISHVNMI